MTSKRHRRLFLEIFRPKVRIFVEINLDGTGNGRRTSPNPDVLTRLTRLTGMALVDLGMDVNGVVIDVGKWGRNRRDILMLF